MTAGPGRSGRTTQGVAYDVLGVDKEPVLLAIHGGPGTDHTLFRPYLDPLTRVAMVVLLDLPGHGRSAPRQDQDYSLTGMAESIEDVRAELGVPRVILLGHSYGGFLSLTYALAHPEHLAGMVLVGTAPSFEFRAESLEVARQRGTPAILDALDRLWEDRLPDTAAFHRAWREVQPLYFHRLPVAEAQRLADRATYTLETRRQIIPTLRDYDVRGRLREINIPALVLVGRHDWITSVAQAQELAARLPRSRLVIFEKSGHNPFVEEQEAFLATVGSWIEETARQLTATSAP